MIIITLQTLTLRIVTKPVYECYVEGTGGILLLQLVLVTRHL